MVVKIGFATLNYLFIHIFNIIVQTVEKLILHDKLCELNNFIMI